MFGTFTEEEAEARRRRNPDEAPIFSPKTLDAYRSVSQSIVQPSFTTLAPGGGSIICELV